MGPREAARSLPVRSLHRLGHVALVRRLAAGRHASRRIVAPIRREQTSRGTPCTSTSLTYGAAMTIERISPVVPVADMASAVATWTTVLGVDPTFVDGDRWAQFDVAGARVALAGTDRASDDTSLMLKVQDAAASHAAFAAGGQAVGELVQGEHEVRFEIVGLDAPVTVYSSS